MFFNNKYFKFFAPENGDGKNDIDVTKLDKPDDIDAKLDEFDKEIGIDNDEFTDGKLQDDLAAPPKAPEEDKAEDGEKDAKEEAKPEDKEIKPDTDKEKEEETPPEKAPETDKQEIQDKDIVITDELIGKMDLGDKEKKYIEKFKGQTLDKLFKSFANAQQLIGKKKEELFKEGQFKDTNLNIPPKPEAKEDASKTKDDLVYGELIKEFNDLPKDPAERKKWLADLNYDDPEAAYRYISKREKIAQEVDTIWKQTEYLHQNYGKINDEKFHSEAEAIQRYAKEKLNLDLKELGYDLTIDIEGNNPILESLLSSEENPENFDRNVIQEFNGVKIIKDGALAKKFFEKELPNIVGKLRTGARKEGIESTKTKKVPPSMATQATKGKGDTKEITADKIKEINDIKQIDELLDKEDAQYFSR